MGDDGGNVWSKGRLDDGTFDTHRLLPFANVSNQRAGCVTTTR